MAVNHMLLKRIEILNFVLSNNKTSVLILTKVRHNQMGHPVNLVGRK